MSLGDRRLSITVILSVVVSEFREGDLCRTTWVDLCSVFCSDLTIKDMTFAEMMSSSSYEYDRLDRAV